MPEKVEPNIIAEYLEIFSKDSEFSVDVKFESDIKRSISKRYASSDELCNLIQLLNNPMVGNSCMSFDDYPYVVTGINIDLLRKHVCLSATEIY